MRRLVRALAGVTLCALAMQAARQPFYDRIHDSKVFGEPRHYRIFLPAAYETSGKSYPVIYYFHGHSDRYTLEKYDNGADTVPKIAAYVATHDVIVVSVDGYVARDYTGFYGGTPYDVMRDGGDFDFGAYFRELVDYIDRQYRTLTDRRNRGTSGLSMGGFMSLYLSARYPELIGSTSAFNPGPEFYVGDKGRRVLWRPKDFVHNHGQTMVRLIRASGDYISQYHEETRDAYAHASDVDFEFRQDEYHRHWATSIAETFDFHMRAFADSVLDNVPAEWSHADAYRSFAVWGYQVNVDAAGPAVVYLERAGQGGLRVRTRQWAPDGPPVPGCTVQIATAATYSPGTTYRMLDYSLRTGEAAWQELTADREGRLRLKVDGAGHQISFSGPGAGAQPPVLLPVTWSDKPRLAPEVDVRLPVRVLNPRTQPMTNVRVTLESEYPTVHVLEGVASVARIPAGQAADVSGLLRLRLTAGEGEFAQARLRFRMTYDGYHQEDENVDVMIAPENIPPPLEIQVLDGRTLKFRVFRQKGNQGGGGSVDREVTEGKGNGNGILEPGEQATIWVRLRQGMDPFDKGNWYRTKVYADSPWLAEVGDLQEQKGLEWTSAKERTSLMRLSPDTPPGAVIPVLLENESWSYHFTPDVRYGREKLYQAFQLHKRHVHRYEIRVSAATPGPPLRIR